MWDLKTIPFTLDSGFDSKVNHLDIRRAKMLPVIRPNLRGLKDQRKKNQRFSNFDLIEHFYKKRLVVERTFAWEDTYRKLTIRYEKLECTFDGFRNLAYSMINFRSIFGNPI